MAIDDALLGYCAREQCAVLRIYQWAEPTLSLGYFQKLEDRAGHAASAELPAVRRATGGGAIVHHHDITYSLVVPQSASEVGAAPAVYAAVHEAVVNWIQQFGVTAKRWSDEDAVEIGSGDGCRGNEFLCFHRRSTGDVVAGGSKLMGSAQRRSKGALLQHGSLLLTQSEFAPSLVGLTDLSPSGRNGAARDRQFVADLTQRISAAIDALLDVRFNEGFPGQETLEELANVCQNRFTNDAWLARM